MKGLDNRSPASVTADTKGPQNDDDFEGLIAHVNSTLSRVGKFIDSEEMGCKIYVAICRIIKPMGDKSVVHFNYDTQKLLKDIIDFICDGLVAIDQKDKMASFFVGSLLGMTKEDIKRFTFGNKFKGSGFFSNPGSFVMGRLRQKEVYPIIDRVTHYIHRVGSLYDHTVRDVIPSFVNVLHFLVAKLLYGCFVPVFKDYVTNVQGKMLNADFAKMNKIIDRFDVYDLESAILELKNRDKK